MAQTQSSSMSVESDGNRSQNLLKSLLTIKSLRFMHVETRPESLRKRTTIFSWLISFRANVFYMLVYYGFKETLFEYACSVYLDESTNSIVIFCASHELTLISFGYVSVWNIGSTWVSVGCPHFRPIYFFQVFRFLKRVRVCSVRFCSCRRTRTCMKIIA